jgi:hypothetical protein
LIGVPEREVSGTPGRENKVSPGSKLDRTVGLEHVPLESSGKGCSGNEAIDLVPGPDGFTQENRSPQRDEGKKDEEEYGPGSASHRRP